VNVITSQFVDAFERQCESLGFDGARVVVEHPIQNRTRPELEALADDAFAAIIDAIFQ